MCLSFQCTHKAQGLCGKCLADDLSGCKNTISCLLWWMSNTRTTHTTFSISKLSQWLSAAQTLPSPTVIPARITVILSLGVAKSSVSTHMETHTRNSNLSCCCTQQERALHSSESLYGIQMDETRDRGGERAGSPLSQFEQQADEITQVVVARLTNEHRDGAENNKTGRATFCLLTHRHINWCVIIRWGKKN